MIILLIVVLSVGMALICGGTLRWLARVQVSYSYLVLISMGLQILIFSTWWRQRPDESQWGLFLYALSLLLLILVVLANWRVPGFPLVAVGLACNALVILANSGRMPASIQALRLAGIADSSQAYAAAPATNSALISASTRLWFLGDILAVPSTWPLPNVFSVGDIAITVGAVWFVWATLRPTLVRRRLKGD
jgi:hypothetical protein